MSFQKTILIIAVVLLIISLIIIGISLIKASKNATWPPNTGVCPDYWVDLSGNGSQCVNVKSLGTCNIPGQLYTTYAGQDSYGNDLTSYSKISLNDCKTACSANSNCYGLSYNPTTQSCWIKNSKVLTTPKITNASINFLLKNTSANTNAMDFTQSPYTGSNGSCSKYNWAENCGVSWDGITYGATNPCLATST